MSQTQLLLSFCERATWCERTNPRSAAGPVRVVHGTSKRSTSLCRLFAITISRDTLTEERL